MRTYECNTPLSTIAPGDLKMINGGAGPGVLARTRGRIIETIGDAVFKLFPVIAGR